MQRPASTAGPSLCDLRRTTGSSHPCTRPCGLAFLQRKWEVVRRTRVRVRLRVKKQIREVQRLAHTRAAWLWLVSVRQEKATETGRTSSAGSAGREGRAWRCGRRVGRSRQAQGQGGPRELRASQGPVTASGQSFSGVVLGLPVTKGCRFKSSVLSKL